MDPVSIAATLYAIGKIAEFAMIAFAIGFPLLVLALLFLSSVFGSRK